MSGATSSEGGFRGSDHDVIPDGAKSFIKALQRSIRAGGVKADAGQVGSGGKPAGTLANLVEEQFGKLTERYFKTTAWPAPDAMGAFVEDDEQVMILYQELYWRHVHAKMTPTVDDKFDSFQNYVNLFNMLLGLNSENPEFELPTSWLWDIVDEFIYQFQTFHLFRNKVSQLQPEEVTALKENEHMWSAQTVLQYLHALVRKAAIDLSKKAEEQPAEEKPIASMFKTLGYFSLVGLLRVNTLLCDYPSALKSLDPVDLRTNRSMFTQVLACHVTLYYNMGLSYLMARRYVDAIKVFCYFLTYMQRSKGRNQGKSFQADLIQKRVDQMLGLLGIAYILSGAAAGSGSDRDSGAQIVDENILHEVKDKLEDRYTRMKSGEIAAFEEVLSASAPKFLTVSAPNYDAGTDVHTDALALQLKVFISEVKQRLNMNDLATYLKLFTTISISKLSVFLNQDDEATLALLLKLSHKTRAQRWVGGAPGDFTWQHYWDVNFTIIKDTVHVTEHRSQRRYGDFFMRQIHKFDESTRDLKLLKPVPQRR